MAPLWASAFAIAAKSGTVVLTSPRLKPPIESRARRLRSALSRLTAKLITEALTLADHHADHQSDGLKPTELDIGERAD